MSIYQLYPLHVRTSLNSYILCFIIEFLFRPLLVLSMFPACISGSICVGDTCRFLFTHPPLSIPDIVLCFFILLPGIVSFNSFLFFTNRLKSLSTSFVF